MRFWSVDRAVDYLIPAPVGTIRGAAFAAVARPDVILGVVNLVPMSSGTAEVAIIVRSDHQRRGIGRCLIEHAIQWGGRDGLTQIIGFIAPDNVAMLALASALQGQTIGRDRYFCTVRWRHPFERSALCRTTQR